MVASAFTAPHVTEFLTVDVTPTMDLLARLKDSRVFAGYKLTPLTIVAKAVLIALRQRTVPELTAGTRPTEEIVPVQLREPGHRSGHAARPDGARHQGRRRLVAGWSWRKPLAALTDTARSGKSTPSELSGGTISITNIGVFGIDAGTPILNPGEAAILAVGAVRNVPWEYKGDVAVGQVMTLSLSFDHRLVDGEQGSRFLALTSAPPRIAPGHGPDHGLARLPVLPAAQRPRPA